MQALEEAICPETSELARTRLRITEPEDGVQETRHKDSVEGA